MYSSRQLSRSYLSFQRYSSFEFKTEEKQNFFSRLLTRRRLPTLFAKLFNHIKSCHSDSIRLVSALTVCVWPAAEKIARKYRDEPRPRQGLLRTREFLMKDLYTFDATKEKALETYETVGRAYSAFFDEFKIPYLKAEAHSGNIGGSLSHEYHLPSQKGEDNIISCSSCSYAANEELVMGAHTSTASKTLSNYADPSNSISSDDSHQNSHPSIETHFLDSFPYKRWIGVSKDRATIFAAIYPAEIEDLTLPNRPIRKTQLNPYVLKKLSNDLVDLSVDHHLGDLEANQVYREFFDYRLPQSFINAYHIEQGRQAPRSTLAPGKDDNLSKPEEKRRGDDNFDLIKICSGDACPNCSQNTLQVQRAVELGHTFHLGTRYSGPLKATFAIDPANTAAGKPKLEVPSDEDDDHEFFPPQGQAYMQMGCHGIGVSRIIAAVASSLVDAQGLNWPRVIAPFETIIIPAKGLESAAVQVYDLLRSVSLDHDDGGNSRHSQTDDSAVVTTSTGTAAGGTVNATSRIDVILDDRDKDLAWKFKDADLIGYPVMVIVGRTWRSKSPGIVEVQCRRLGFRKEVLVQELRMVVTGLLDRL